MPRILLIVDEFQEFFVEDDKLAQDAVAAARPPGPPGPGVRHPRAPRLADARRGLLAGPQHARPDGGPHRAAVQRGRRAPDPQRGQHRPPGCSPGPARRSTTTPTAWSRATTLPGRLAPRRAARGLPAEGVGELATERHLDPAPRRSSSKATPPADLADNHLLSDVLDASRLARAALAPQAWLGDAIAIKDPTPAVFRRQGGNQPADRRPARRGGPRHPHQLPLEPRPATQICGLPQSAESAKSVDSALSTFYILDGTRPDSPEAGFWRKLKSELPIDAQVVTTRDAAETISKIAAEVDRRLSSGDQNAEPIFLFIYNLARFRELKKSDEFSFGEEAARAATSNSPPSSEKDRLWASTRSSGATPTTTSAAGSTGRACGTWSSGSCSK